jgi:hypothetical protein
MSEKMTVQPITKPRLGPIERVTHENVVPQSGSTRFIALYAVAMKNSGMNETMITAGLCTPTPWVSTKKPTVAARL